LSTLQLKNSKSRSDCLKNKHLCYILETVASAFDAQKPPWSSKI
jgi:hypothetical protein